MIDRHYFHQKCLKFEAGHPIRRITVHDKFLGIPVTYYLVKTQTMPYRTLAEFETEAEARAWAQAQQERRAA